MKRVVITGIGAVSPNGIGAENYARACIDGRSGISLIEGIDLSKLRSTAAGQVKGFELTSVMDAAEVKRVPRMVPLCLAASREAIEQAGIDLSDVKSQRQIGISLGTGGGGLVFLEDQYREFFTAGRASLYSVTAGTHGNLSSEVSIALKLRGPSHVLSTGCTSSTDAIGHAMMMIRAGVVPMMLAGGADAPIARGILHGFEKMRVISMRHWDDPSRASRPFSADRDGFILGEGAWMFVLEDLEHATERGATIFAEVAGYGSTCDAYHRVQIAPDVQEPVRAMEIALKDAGISGEQIDHVNLHGTGTELNDRLETLAMQRLLGDRAFDVPMSATKSMIGHPQGAGGAAGLAAMILAMHAGYVHPTINVDVRDPQCDLDYVTEGARKVDVHYALCNCIAFGSKNSALVVRKS